MVPETCTCGKGQTEWKRKIKTPPKIQWRGVVEVGCDNDYTENENMSIGQENLTRKLLMKEYENETVNNFESMKIEDRNVYDRVKPLESMSVERTLSNFETSHYYDSVKSLDETLNYFESMKIDDRNDSAKPPENIVVEQTLISFENMRIEEEAGGVIDRNQELRVTAQYLEEYRRRKWKKIKGWRCTVEVLRETHYHNEDCPDGVSDGREWEDEDTLQ